MTNKHVKSLSVEMNDEKTCTKQTNYTDKKNHFFYGYTRKIEYDIRQKYNYKEITDHNRKFNIEDEYSNDVKIKFYNDYLHNLIYLDKKNINFYEKEEANEQACIYLYHFFYKLFNIHKCIYIYCDMPIYRNHYCKHHYHENKTKKVFTDAIKELISYDENYFIMDEKVKKPNTTNNKKIEIIFEILNEKNESLESIVNRFGKEYYKPLHMYEKFVQNKNYTINSLSEDIKSYFLDCNYDQPHIYYKIFTCINSYKCENIVHVDIQDDIQTINNSYLKDKFREFTFFKCFIKRPKYDKLLYVKKKIYYILEDNEKDKKGVNINYNESLYENVIKLMENYNIYYIHSEMTFDDLRSSNGKGAPRYDMFGVLCNKNNGQTYFFMIEYDDGSHFIGDENTTKLDLIKEAYCWKKSYSLLRIHYKDDMNKSLTKFFDELSKVDAIPIIKYTNFNEYDKRFTNQKTKSKKSNKQIKQPMKIDILQTEICDENEISNIIELPEIELNLSDIKMRTIKKTY